MSDIQSLVSEMDQMPSISMIQINPEIKPWLIGGLIGLAIGAAGTAGLIYWLHVRKITKQQEVAR